MTGLLTGASGFVGGYIWQELNHHHTITTLGRRLVGDRHISCDLVREIPDLAGKSFNFVVHAAGKAHAVPRSMQERADYHRVNVLGTAQLLASLEKLPVLPQSFVQISTVLVYGRVEGSCLDEQSALEASDAYGISKIRAEAIVQAWCKTNHVRCTILRLPLVVGKQPNGNIAAMMKGIRRGYYIRIGGSVARRSMVRADDVAAVIVRAAAVEGIYNLTDGQHPSVYELEDAIAKTIGRKRIPTMSPGIAKAIARVGDGINALIGRQFPLDSVALQKLTSSLTFSDESARQHLDWTPRSVLDSFS